MSRYSQPTLMPSYPRMSRTYSSQSLSSTGPASTAGCSDLYNRSQSVMNLMEERLRENINDKLRRHQNSSSTNLESLANSATTSDMPIIVHTTTTGRIQRRSRSVSYSDLLSEQQQLPTTSPVANVPQRDTTNFNVKVPPPKVRIRSCVSVGDRPESLNNTANRFPPNFSGGDVPRSLRWRNNAEDRQRDLSIENNRSPVRSIVVKTDALDSGFYDNNGVVKKTRNDSWIKSSEDQQPRSGSISFKQPLSAVHENLSFKTRRNAVIANTSDVDSKSIPDSGYVTPSLDVDNCAVFAGTGSAVNRTESARGMINGASTDKLGSSLCSSSIPDTQKSLRTLAPINHDDVRNGLIDVTNNNNHNVLNKVDKGVPEYTERRTTKNITNDNLFVPNTTSNTASPNVNDHSLDTADILSSSSYVSSTYMSLSSRTAAQTDGNIRVKHEPTNSAVSDSATIDSGIERTSSFSSDPRTTNSFEELDDASLTTEEVDDSCDSTVESLGRGSVLSEEYRIEGHHGVFTSGGDHAKISGQPCQDVVCLDETNTVLVSSKDIAPHGSGETLNPDFGQSTDYRKQLSPAHFLDVPKPRPSPSVPLIHPFTVTTPSSAGLNSSKNLSRKGDRVVNPAAESIRQVFRLEEQRLAVTNGTADKGNFSTPQKQLNFPEKVSAYSTIVATGGSVSIPRRSTDFRTLSKSYESSSLPPSRTGAASGLQATTDPRLASCNVGKIIDKLTAPKVTTSLPQKSTQSIANRKSVRAAVSVMEAGNTALETSVGAKIAKDRNGEVSTLTAYSGDNVSRKRRELLEQSELNKPNTSNSRVVGHLNQASQSKPPDSQNVSNHKIGARTLLNGQTINGCDSPTSQYTAVNFNTSNPRTEASEDIPCLVLSRDSNTNMFPSRIQSENKSENFLDEHPVTPTSSYGSLSPGTSLEKTTDYENETPPAISPSSSFTDDKTFPSVSSTSHVSLTCDDSMSDAVTEQNTVICVERTKTSVSENVTSSQKTGRFGSQLAGDEYIDVELLKGPTGLGFCIEGGVDSPTGNCPITVKRLYNGATAARELLQQGDVIICVNDQPFSGNMTHFTAWNYLKALPDGIARITIKRTR